MTSVELSKVPITKEIGFWKKHTQKDGYSIIIVPFKYTTILIEVMKIEVYELFDAYESMSLIYNTEDLDPHYEYCMEIGLFQYYKLYTSLIKKNNILLEQL